MTYFEKSTNAYRDAMMELGINEDVVNFCLFAFETGFKCGTLDKDDMAIQETMIRAILNKNEIN